MELKPEYHITQPVQDLIDERDSQAQTIEALRAEALAWRARAESPVIRLVILTHDANLAVAIAKFVAGQDGVELTAAWPAANPCVLPED